MRLKRVGTALQAVHKEYTPDERLYAYLNFPLLLAGLIVLAWAALGASAHLAARTIAGGVALVAVLATVPVTLPFLDAAWRHYFRGKS